MSAKNAETAALPAGLTRLKRALAAGAWTLLLAVGLCVAAGARAGTTEGEAAVLGGHPRLLLPVLKQLPPQRQAAVLHQLGFLHQGRDLRQVSGQISLRPTLRYDENINNGIDADVIWLGGLPFRTDSSGMARAGAVAGVQLSGAGAWSVAQGAVLSLTGAATFEHAVEHNLSIRSGWVSGCASAWAGGNLWTGLCQTFSREDRALSSAEGAVTGLSFAHLSRGRLGSLERAVEFGSVRSDGHRRGFAALQFRLASRSLGYIGGGLYGEEPRAGQNTVQWRISGTWGGMVAGKPLLLNGFLQRDGGARFFGIHRQDRVVGLRLDRDLRPGLGVSLGYRKRSSNTGLYGEGGFSLNFHVRPLRLFD